MDFGLISVLALGLLLGIKHALEPDHMIAVTTIASRSKTIFQSSLAGVFWGVGHTLTIMLISIIFIAMKTTMPESMIQWLEVIVGLMIIFLGITVMIKKDHHISEKKANQSTYLKSMGVGFIHGLAGSGAMILLTASTVDSLSGVILYLVVFGIGTSLGMLAFTTVISLPFVFSLKKVTIHTCILRLTGVLSVGFGLYYVAAALL